MEYQDLYNKEGNYITVNIPGTSAATAANYGILFVANYGIEIVSVSERHETAGSDATDVLDVIKVDKDSAISTGTSILASTFNLKSTINTLVTKQGIGLSSARILKPNQLLALKPSATLTSVAGVHVTIYFKRANYGSYR
jgi:hypothetical protein